jgi:hypothetical protein
MGWERNMKNQKSKKSRNHVVVYPVIVQTPMIVKV